MTDRNKRPGADDRAPDPGAGGRGPAAPDDAETGDSAGERAGGADRPQPTRGMRVGETKIGPTNDPND